MEEVKEKEIYKVEALTRFLFAPTGRIYDPKDIFEVTTTKTDYDYLIDHKLCKKAPSDAKITETDQDRRDKIAIEAKELEEKTKEEVAKDIITKIKNHYNV